MGDIGFSEMLVILIVAIIAFGKDLPMVARKVGKMVGKARRYLLDIKDEVQRQIPLEDFDVRDDIRNLQKDVKEATTDEDLYHPPPEPPPAAPEPPKPEEAVGTSAAPPAAAAPEPPKPEQEVPK